MRLFYTILLSLHHLGLHAQDTIQVATDKSSYVRFVEPVKLVDPGNQDYQTFIKGNVVFLKAKTALAKPTSLMVMGDVQMNVWIIEYKANPKSLVYHFPPLAAGSAPAVAATQPAAATTANPAPSTNARVQMVASSAPGLAPTPVPVVTTNTTPAPAQNQSAPPTTPAPVGAFSRDGRDVQYPVGVTEETIRYVSGYKRIYSDLGAVNARVKAVLNSVLLNDEYLFLVLDFINASQIAYTIDFVGMEHRTSGGFRKRDTGENGLFPPVGYDFIQTVDSGDEHRMVFIFKTYAWGDKDLIRFSISEERGDRKLEFNFDARELNQAARIPTDKFTKK